VGKSLFFFLRAFDPSLKVAVPPVIAAGHRVPGDCWDSDFYLLPPDSSDALFGFGLRSPNQLPILFTPLDHLEREREHPPPGRCCNALLTGF